MWRRSGGCLVARRRRFSVLSKTTPIEPWAGHTFRRRCAYCAKESAARSADGGHDRSVMEITTSHCRVWFWLNASRLTIGPMTFRKVTDASAAARWGVNSVGDIDQLVAGQLAPSTRSTISKSPSPIDQSISCSLTVSCLRMVRWVDLDGGDQPLHSPDGCCTPILSRSVNPEIALFKMFRLASASMVSSTELECRIRRCFPD